MSYVFGHWYGHTLINHYKLLKNKCMSLMPVIWLMLQIKTVEKIEKYLYIALYTAHNKLNN